MKKTLFVDMVTGIVLMLVSAYWFYDATRMMKVDLGIGPAGYPKFVSVCLFLLALILTVQSVIRGLPKPAGKIDRKVMLRLVIFVAATVVYTQAMQYLGFLLLTPFYLFFACWFFRYRKLVTAAIASIAVTGVLYVIFGMLFFVALPEFRLW